MGTYKDMQKYRESRLRRSRRAIRKRRELCDWLREAPCADCQQTFPPECMDFDHVRGVKLAGIAHMLDYAPERLQAELQKCELVCSNCHRTRTKRRMNGAA